MASNAALPLAARSAGERHAEADLDRIGQPYGGAGRKPMPTRKASANFVRRKSASYYVDMVSSLNRRVDPALFNWTGVR